MIAEEQIPIAKGNKPPLALLENAPFSSTIPARVIAGIPRRNENRAASFLCQLVNREAVSVQPALDVPGMNASS